LRLEALHWYEAASCSIWCSRQAEEDVCGIDRSYPLVPGVDEVCGAPRRVLARRVVVELDPDVVEEPRLKGFAYPLVREWTLGRCRQGHLLAGAVGLEVRRKFTVVVWVSSLNVEVNAVKHGIAKGPLVGVAAQEVVPDVLGELEGVLLGVEGVASCAAADGEHDLDILGLAEGDVGGEVGAGVGVGVAVACEVELRGRLPRAEAAEEGDVDKGPK